MKNDFYILNRDARDLENLKVKVDLIYIDPPFGLNRNFTMTESDGETREFADHWNSFDDFIDWYSDIITKCYNALNKDGWLYCHNNHISNALVLSKLSILDKYYTNISWRRSHPHNNIKNGWGNIVDSIMVFKKGNPYFEVEYGTLDEKYADNSFRNKDENGYYALGPITGEKSRIGYLFEYNGFNPQYGWRKKKEDIIKLDQEGLLHFGKNKPYKKIYANTSKGVPVQNMWNDIHPISRREGRIYPTQKPIKLLERIVKSSCPPNGIVLDPFCGGGTTLAATINCGEGRRCITSDISEKSCDLVFENVNASLYTFDRVGVDIW